MTSRLPALWSLALLLLARTAFAQEVEHPTGTRNHTAVVVALPDSFQTEGTLAIPVPGVLGNDSGESGDSLVAVLETEPANGELTFHPDGSFSYVPREGFTGMDVFTYRTQISRPTLFNIDPNLSFLDIDATVDVGATADDSESSHIDGVIRAYLYPSQTNTATIQVDSLHLVLTERIRFSFGFLGGLLKLVAVAEASTMDLNMIQPGPLALVENNSFTQTENLLGFSGNLVLSGVMEDTVDVNVSGNVDLAGTITQVADSVQIEAPVNFSGNYIVDSRTSLDVTMEGTVVGRAAVVEPERSEPVTVSIRVGSTTASDPDSELPSRLALHAAYPNPFNPATTLTLDVDRTQRVRVAAYNVLGQRVRTLYDGVLQARSGHVVSFDASALPGGLYLIRAEGERSFDVRTVILEK